MSEWTIRHVIEWTAKDFAAKGLDSPRLDAELLVAEALGVKRVELYLDLDRPLQPPERERIRGLLKRRRAREPVAYILGRREFYGRIFEVGPAVLVPRPDTETLVERALGWIAPEADGRILDLGTGSGAIAVTVAAERPNVAVDAADRSAEALEVAHRNAVRHGVADRVAFRTGDLFDPLPAGARYDLVVSNPPYVVTGDLDSLQPEITQWEPRVALDGGADGLDTIRRIAAGVAERLAPSGGVLLEVGAGQAGQVERLLEAGGLVDVAFHKDLAGILRVVAARRGD